MRDDFQIWVDAVCEQVRFWPDREGIAKELRVHYEDHCKALERLSYEPDLAAERSLRAMGSPQEVGRALDRVHRPWLGWLWVLSRVLAWGLGLCLFVTIVVDGGSRYPAGTAPAFDAGVQKVNGETPAGHAEEVCTVAWPPPVRFGSYTVTVRQAACFHEEAAPAWDWEMVLWLEIHTPDIWLGPCDLTLLEAVDSSESCYDGRRSDWEIWGNVSEQGMGTYDGTVTICGTDPIPEWIEVRHETAGWTMRLELEERGAL